jgi:predicted DNA-binding transcriptional regulator AlpA
MTLTYSVIAAAHACGITPKRLYRYLRAGKFPRSYKANGTSWCVSPEDVEDYKAGRLDVSGVFVRPKASQ